MMLERCFTSSYASSRQPTSSSPSACSPLLAPRAQCSVPHIRVKWGNDHQPLKSRPAARPQTPREPQTPPTKNQRPRWAPILLRQTPLTSLGPLETALAACPITDLPLSRPRLALVPERALPLDRPGNHKCRTA